MLLRGLRRVVDFLDVRDVLDVRDLPLRRDRCVLRDLRGFCAFIHMKFFG